MVSKAERMLWSAALTLAGCTTTATQPGRAETLTGWYWQRGDQALFQSCGDSRQWIVAPSPQLRERARAFRLEPDTPVYVSVVGTRSPESGELAIAQVEQFGSPDPVRGCALTGIVSPTPDR